MKFQNGRIIDISPKQKPIKNLTAQERLTMQCAQLTQAEIEILDLVKPMLERLADMTGSLNPALVKDTLGEQWPTYLSAHRKIQAYFELNPSLAPKSNL